MLRFRVCVTSARASKSIPRQIGVQTDFCLPARGADEERAAPRIELPVHFGRILLIPVHSHDDKHLPKDGDFLALGQMTSTCVTNTWPIQNRNVGARHALSRPTNVGWP